MCDTFVTPCTARFLCPWNFPGKNTGVGCHFFLQGVFLTQESNLCLLCLLLCRWILYYWATREAPNLHFRVSFFNSVSSVPLLICVRLFATPMNYSTPGLPVYQELWGFAETHVHQVCDAIQPSHPLSSPSPPTFNLYQHWGLFQWVSSSCQVAKVLEFQLQHQSFNEYSGLISFRTDWLDLLAVQGTLQSLLQYHSSKASILQCSAFFIVQLSHPYMTTGKTIALTRWTFVDKVISLLFNLLSSFLILKYLCIHPSIHLSIHIESLVSW